MFGAKPFEAGRGSGKDVGEQHRVSRMALADALKSEVQHKKGQSFGSLWTGSVYSVGGGGVVGQIERPVFGMFWPLQGND